MSFSKKYIIKKPVIKGFKRRYSRIHDLSFSNNATEPVVKVYTYNMTNGAAGEKLDLPMHQYDAMLKDLKQKNGFVMAVYEFSTMNRQLAQMKKMCERLIELIDNELER